MQYSADFIITMPGFRFSVHTGQNWTPIDTRIDGVNLLALQAV